MVAQVCKVFQAWKGIPDRWAFQDYEVFQAHKVSREASDQPGRLGVAAWLVRLEVKVPRDRPVRRDLLHRVSQVRRENLGQRVRRGRLEVPVPPGHPEVKVRLEVRVPLESKVNLARQASPVRKAHQPPGSSVRLASRPTPLC